jgi:hypothetical protein
MRSLSNWSQSLGSQQMIDGPFLGRPRPPSGDMTTDNTVAEIEAARGTALGIELDRHPSVRPELKPIGPNQGRYQTFVFAQRAVIRCAQHMVDCTTVVR